MRRLISQMFRFGVVGGIAFLIDYSLLIFLTQVCHVHYLISATISYSVSLVFNYLASMRYVFKGKQGASKIREFIIFAVLSTIGLGLNDLILWIGVALTFDYRIVKLVASAIVMSYNFITRKLILEEHRASIPTDIDTAVISYSTQDSESDAAQPPSDSSVSTSMTTAD